MTTTISLRVTTMMLLRFLSWALLSLVTLCASADEADARLPQLEDFLPEGCYQSGFYQQQKSLTGLDQTLETQGSFAFACDKGLLWHTASPVDETLIYQLRGKTRLLRADGSEQLLSGSVQRHLGKMLNSLLAGDRAYIDKTFVFTASDQAIRLSPKQKRMEKFIRAIDIRRQGEDVTIHMHHQGDEFTAIRVHQVERLTSLSLAQCTRLGASAGRSLAPACAQLLNL